jgi:hypothetical protein
LHHLCRALASANTKAEASKPKPMQPNTMMHVTVVVDFNVFKPCAFQDQQVPISWLLKKQR